MVISTTDIDSITNADGGGEEFTRQTSVSDGANRAGVTIGGSNLSSSSCRISSRGVEARLNERQDTSGRAHDVLREHWSSAHTKERGHCIERRVECVTSEQTAVREVE